MFTLNLRVSPARAILVYPTDGFLLLYYGMFIGGRVTYYYLRRNCTVHFLKLNS